MATALAVAASIATRLANPRRSWYTMQRVTTTIATRRSSPTQRATCTTSTTPARCSSWPAAEPRPLRCLTLLRIPRLSPLLSRIPPRNRSLRRSRQRTPATALFLKAGLLRPPSCRWQVPPLQLRRRPRSLQSTRLLPKLPVKARPARSSIPQRQQPASLSR